MMENAKCGHASDDVQALKEISFFTFRIDGILFGMEADQVAGVLHPDHAKEEFNSLVYFHEKVSFRERTVTYEMPKVIVIKNGGEKPGIIIDKPEDIVTVKIEDIRPMPMLICGSGRSMAVWGGVLYNREMMLLVDLSRLAAGSLPSKDPPRNN